MTKTMDKENYELVRANSIDYFDNLVVADIPVEVISGQTMDLELYEKLYGEYEELSATTPQYNKNGNKDVFMSGFVQAARTALGLDKKSFSCMFYRRWERRHNKDTVGKIKNDSKLTTEEYWSCIGYDCANCPNRINGKRPFENLSCACCGTAKELHILRRTKNLVK